MVFISFVRARRTPGPSLPTVPQIAVRFPVFGQKSRSYARPFGPQMIGSYPPERPGGDCFSIFFLLFPDMPASTIFFFLPEKKGALPSFPACSQPSPPLPLAWSRSEKPAAPRSRNILQLRNLRCIQRQKAQPFFSRQLVGELFVSGFAQPLGGEPPLITASRMQPPAAVWSLA